MIAPASSPGPPIYLKSVEVKKIEKLSYLVGCGFEVKFARTTGLRIAEIQNQLREQIDLRACAQINYRIFRFL